VLTRGELLELFGNNPAFAREVMLLCLEKKRGKLTFYVDLAKEALGGGNPERDSLAVKQFWIDTFGDLYEKVSHRALLNYTNYLYAMLLYYIT